VIRILLAEDHETVREGLRLLLNVEKDIEIVGEAGDGQEAIDMARTLKPDVLVLDLTMPRMNGLMVTRALQADPGPAVVVLTRHDDEAYVHELARLQVMAYVLKQSPSSELLTAIRAAAAGQQHFDQALPQTDRTRLRGRSAGPPRLTDREVEVLRMMSAGHSNKEIASALDISIKTAEVHKANAMRKMGLRGRTDVVRYAVLQGWFRDP